MKLSKRMTFQLTPLLDLLLIVLFAQYLEVEKTTEQVAAEALAVRGEDDVLADSRRQLRELESRLDFTAAELAESQLAHAEGREEYDRRINELIADRNRLESKLAQALAQQDRLAEMTRRLFQIPEELLAEALDPENKQNRTAEELERMKKAFAEFSRQRADEMMKLVVAHNELRKRSDIWEISLNTQRSPNGQLLTTRAFLTPDFSDSSARRYEFPVVDYRNRPARFRNGQVNPAEPAAVLAQQRAYDLQAAQEFAEELFEIYKTRLPQPKATVVVLLTYPADTPDPASEIAKRGLQLAVRQMQADTNNQSTFVYSVLGFTKP